MPLFQDLGSRTRRISTVDDGSLVALAALAAICHVAVVLALLQRCLYLGFCTAPRLSRRHFITINISPYLYYCLCVICPTAVPILRRFRWPLTSSL
jgi:hypothetical protein